jgi:hypothetical protein
MGSWLSIIPESVVEITSLLPDSILFGSLVLYMLTQNVAFSIFAIFIFENVISHRVLSWFFVKTESVPSGSTKSDCRAGFKSPQLSIDRIYDHGTYPSYGMFSITSIATYLSLATQEFSYTMDAMSKTSPSWGSRPMVAYILTGLFVCSFFCYRWYTGCESTSELLYAIVLGMIIGIAFFWLNKAIFGIESMNFLGLPYLETKDSVGAPIYVCSTDPK